MNNTVHLREYLLPGGPSAAILPSRHAGVEMHDHDYYELVYIEEGIGLHDLEGRYRTLVDSLKVYLRVAVVPDEAVEEKKAYMPSEQAGVLMKENDEVKNLVKELGLDIK